MLVLSRKNRESVIVGGVGGFERVLKVTVLKIKGSQVTLGFEGDADIPVHRSEIWERMSANNELKDLGNENEGRHAARRDTDDPRRELEPRKTK